MLPFVVPAAAWADIYKWTDEQGSINFSNIPPPKTDNVKNVKVVTKEAPPSATAPALPSSATTTAQRQPTAAEQELLARVKNLERQLQAQRLAATASPPPPPSYPAYYQPPPPPPTYSDSGYDPGYYPNYYPAYAYPVVPAYAVYPQRAYSARQAFVGSRGGMSHGGGGHGGRR